METVLESIDEQHQSMNPAMWKQKMQTGVSRFTSPMKAPQTTESNIAMQQRLDFASAEEFISFPR